MGRFLLQDTRCLHAAHLRYISALITQRFLYSVATTTKPPNHQATKPPSHQTTPPKGDGGGGDGTGGEDGGRDGRGGYGLGGGATGAGVIIFHPIKSWTSNPSSSVVTVMVHNPLNSRHSPEAGA